MRISTDKSEERTFEVTPERPVLGSTPEPEIPQVPVAEPVTVQEQESVTA